jgi:hypothetical protein
LKFPQEKPTASDFRLWREAIRRVVPVEGLAVRLGRCLHNGYKVWDWRVSAENGYLLNYKEDSMDAEWHLTLSDCAIEIIGRPCSVRELQGGRKITTSVSPAVDEVLAPQTILDVIKGWKQSWFWRKLEFIGDLDWLRDSIAEGSVLGVAAGSFISELFPDANSCAFVLECQNNRGRILGRLLEGSKDSCAFRGELLGLLALHLILLAVNTLYPELTGKVRIISDCLGALRRVVDLPADRLPSGVKHSDILKILMLHCRSF